VGNYGWAYVAGTGKPGGPTGSVQLKKDTATLTGSADLVFSDDVLNLTGTLNVSGTINANQLNIDVVNKTVINLSASGDTIFGDTVDDTHQFTGSVLLTSSGNPLRIEGLLAGAGGSSGHYLALNSSNQVVLTSSVPESDSGLITQYTNPGDNRVITSIDASGINAEANFTFNGTNLDVVGSITSSVSVSSSAGEFHNLTGSYITGSGIETTTLTARNIGGTLTTPSQLNITAVGTLTSLTVSGDVTVDTNVLKVQSTTNRVGIGVTDPVRKLEVLDTAAQLRLTYQRAAGFDPLITSDIKTTSAGHLILSGSGGRVGIGTDSPSRMLDVNGHMRVSGNLEITGALRAKVSEFIVDANNITFGDSITDTLIFNAATGTIMNGLNWDNDTWVLDSDQNRIGIGVEHPTVKLHVSSSNQTLLKLSYNDSNEASFKVSSTGDLTIDPTGNYLTASSGLRVSGTVFLGTDLEHDTVVSGELTASVAVSSSLGMFTGLTSSVITDGTATMRGGNISNVGTLTANFLGGTLTTPAQTNITSVGTLTGLTASGDINFNNTFYLNKSNNRIGIGRSDPTRPIEVLHTDPQLKLSYSKFQFGVSENVFSEIYTNASGYLVLTASSERIGIGTATPTSTLALSGTLNVSSSGNPIKILGLLSSSLAGPGSYLGVDSSGQVVLTSSAGGAGGGGGGSSAVNGPVNTNSILIEGYNYFTTISAPTIVSLPSASIGNVVHVKAGPGVSAVNYIRISGSESGDTIDGINHIDLESPYGALAFVYVASNKDWRIL
jgi:hypothetical protein